MRAIWFIFMLFFCTSLLAQSDEESSTSNELVVEDYSSGYESENVLTPAIKPDYSGEHVSVKPFDKEEWKKVVGNTDYSESQAKREKDGENTAQSGDRADSGRRKDSSVDNEGNSESNSIPLSPLGGALLQIIAYGIIILLIGLIIYFIIKNIPSQNTAIKKEHIEEHEQIENIEDLDVDNLLKKALAEGNYRLVIRLNYLALLKTLHQKGLIIWEKDKTNKEYVTELSENEELCSDVQSLTLTYEKVWYGEHGLQRETAQTTIRGFEIVQQKINLINNVQ